MSKIDIIMDKFPDKVYKKDNESNLYKFISAFSTELDEMVDKMEEIRNSHFVDSATGKDLEKIASILNLYRLRNESDESFRGRIKTKVPSFVGGGTITAIRQVIRTFLGVEPTIIEHYKPGEGHAYFDNGVLNGFDISLNQNTVYIESGTAYIEGKRITVNNIELELINNINFIFLNDMGEFRVDTIESKNENEIILYSINDNQVIDKRFLLDPYTHFITNIATITVQIPYNFDESKITIEDTKNIMKNTKAAGIAILMRIAGLYEENLLLKDAASPKFMVGLSRMGSNNVIGG